MIDLFRASFWGIIIAWILYAIIPAWVIDILGMIALVLVCFVACLFLLDELERRYG